MHKNWYQSKRDTKSLDLSLKFAKRAGFKKGMDWPEVRSIYEGFQVLSQQIGFLCRPGYDA